MSNGTILITDDEPHMRRLIGFTLRATGQRVLQANSGEAAIEIISREPIDLLIIDYAMDGINGLETIAVLRKMERGAKLPIILITARGDTGIRASAESEGISAFITKPFSPVELTALVKQLLAA
ncbi:MAG: response regulator [Opitutaceae bacterium]